VKTLVIGASGYVGGRVVRAFSINGHDVSGLVRSDTAAAKAVDAGAAVIRGDLRDLDSLAPHLAATDCVVFAPMVSFRTEQRAIEMLLDRMADTGKTLIFTSGTSVLAKRTEGYWFDGNYGEDDPWDGDEANRARIPIEAMVRAGESRPPLVWGHGHAPPIHALHGSARTGAICYVGPGLNVFSTIHVDDLAEIYVLAATRGAPGALYHAVSGETNFRSLAEHVGHLRGLGTRSISGSMIEEVFGPFLGPVVFASCNRTRCPRTHAELGWLPNPERLDLFAELAHPAFMGIDASAEIPGFTLSDAIRDGRRARGQPRCSQGEDQSNRAVVDE
jgi:nucleoside-diphosphate-sugar epimerase